MSDIEPLLTVNQAAEALALSRSTIYRLHYEGAIPFIKVGRKAVRIHPDEVRRIQQDGLGS